MVPRHHDVGVGDYIEYPINNKDRARKSYLKKKKKDWYLCEGDVKHHISPWEGEVQHYISLCEGEVQHYMYIHV